MCQAAAAAAEPDECVECNGDPVLAAGTTGSVAGTHVGVLRAGYTSTRKEQLDYYCFWRCGSCIDNKHQQQ